MKTRDLLTIPALTLLAAACASSGTRSSQAVTTDSGAATASAPAATSTATPAAESSTRRTRRSANLITPEEIRESTHGNVYDLVAAMRPEWLRASGPSSIRGGGGGVAAYMDQQRLGAATALRQIPINQARAIRFYPAAEAQSRFGLDNMAGAIQVETGGR